MLDGDGTRIVAATVAETHHGARVCIALHAARTCGGGRRRLGVGGGADVSETILAGWLHRGCVVAM